MATPLYVSAMFSTREAPLALLSESCREGLADWTGQYAKVYCQVLTAVISSNFISSRPVPPGEQLFKDLCEVAGRLGGGAGAWCRNHTTADGPSNRQCLCTSHHPFTDHSLQTFTVPTPPLTRPHLSEGELNGLVLLPLQVVYHVHNGAVCPIHLLLPTHQLLPTKSVQLRIWHYTAITFV